MVTTLGLNKPNTEIDKTIKLMFFYCGLILLRNKKRRITLFLKEIMEDIGMFAKQESHPRNPVNIEEGNLREGEIWVNIDESRKDNPSELQRSVKELRAY